MIDQQKADGSVGGLQSQTKLELERVAEVTRVVGDSGIFPGHVVHPGQREVVKSGEACLIDNRAGHCGEACHRRDRGGEEGERNRATTVVLPRR